MQTRGITDFTTGSIPRHLIRFAMPMFLGNLLQAAYNTVDSIWVGRFLGPDSLAAVSVGFPIIFALVALVEPHRWPPPLVSQCRAKDNQMVSLTIANSMTMVTAAGIVLAVLRIPGALAHARLLRAPVNIMDEGSGDMLGIYMLGLIPRSSTTSAARYCRARRLALAHDVPGSSHAHQHSA